YCVQPPALGRDAPTAPFTRVGRPNTANRAKPRVPSATARASRTTRDAASRLPRSARTTTSGSSSASSPSRSPLWAAAKNAWITARCRHAEQLRDDDGWQRDREVGEEIRFPAARHGVDVVEPPVAFNDQSSDCHTSRAAEDPRAESEER